MDHNPDRICVWPGYFNVKTSRRNGRRVPEFLSFKTRFRRIILRCKENRFEKIKREENVSHPNRPYGKEGRLWVSRSGAKGSIGASNKELLQMIGGQWRQMQKDAKENEAQRVAEDQKLLSQRSLAAATHSTRCSATSTQGLQKAFWFQKR